MGVPVVGIPRRERRGRTSLGHPVCRSGRVCLLTLFLSWAFGACATFGRFSFERPEIHLQGIRLTRIDADGGAFDLILDIYNPNEYRLRASRLEADLTLEEVHVASARIDRSIVVDATAHGSVEVPVAWRWGALATAARAVLTRDTAEYELEARLDLRLPVGNQPVVLREAGRVPIRRATR